MSIIRLNPLEEIKSFVDDIQRFESERTLKEPTERDIDDYLFLHNTVVRLNELPGKINELIVTINAMLDVIDPPKP